MSHSPIYSAIHSFVKRIRHCWWRLEILRAKTRSVFKTNPSRVAEREGMRGYQQGWFTVMEVLSGP